MLTKIAFINHLLHDIHGVSIQIHGLNQDMILSITSVNIKYEITRQTNTMCVFHMAFSVLCTSYSHINVLLYTE